VHGKGNSLCTRSDTHPVINTMSRSHHDIPEAAAAARPGAPLNDAHLGEWTHEQKAVGQSDLHASQAGSNASAVGGQVGQVVGHDGRGGHRCLQHAHERVTVQGLDNLGLHDDT